MALRPASYVLRVLFLPRQEIQLALALAAGRIDIRNTFPTRRLALLPRPPPVGIAPGLVSWGRDGGGSALGRIGGRPSRAGGGGKGFPGAEAGSKQRAGRLG